MKRILLIGLGVVVFTVVLSVITASLMAAPLEDLPTGLIPPVAVAAGNHLVRTTGDSIGLLYFDLDALFDFHVLYLMSGDNGVTWTLPDTLNTSPISVMEEPPDLQVGPSGDVYAAWDGSDDLGSDTTFIYFARRDAATGAWEVPRKIMAAERIAAGPRMAVGPDSVIHMVYYDESDSLSDVMYSQSADGGMTWTTPVGIDGIDDFAQTPDIGVGPDGDIHVVFADIIDILTVDTKADEIVYVTSSDGGDNWSDTTAVSARGGAQSTFGLALPAVSVDRDTTVHVVWAGDDGANRDIYHSYLPVGGAWTTPYNVSNSSDISIIPSLTSDITGVTYLFYEEFFLADSNEIYFAYFDDDEWSVKGNFSDSEGDSRGPCVTAEPDRQGFMVTWLESGGSFRIEFALSPDVWPGDTDNNGVVDAADVLPLALYWNDAGPARSADESPYSWTAHPTIPWTWPAWAATYADANGDGLVDARDILPIGLNWSRTHETRGQTLATDIDEIDHTAHLPAYLRLREALDASADSEPVKAMRRFLDELIERGEDSGAFDPLPGSPALGVAHPNPAGEGVTEISFNVATPGEVEITVYDPRGRRVRELLSEWRDGGSHQVKWDGRDEDGGRVSSGIYLCRITVPGASETEKILWVR